MIHRSAAFRARSDELRAVLNPLLPASADTQTTPPTPLNAAQSIDELVRSIFSGSQAAEASLESNLQRLADLLAPDDLRAVRAPVVGECGSCIDAVARWPKTATDLLAAGQHRRIRLQGVKWLAEEDN